MDVQELAKTRRAESPFVESPSKESAFGTPSTVSPVPSTCCDPKDDLDLMLLHEDFPILLSAAADLKEIREHIASHRDKKTDSGEAVVVPVFQQIAKSTRHNDQVLHALDRMKRTFDLKSDFEETKIPRGRYTVIDSVLDDAIGKLQHEFESCETWIQNQFPKTPAGGIAYKKRERGALAVKYPKAQTDILMEWMIENREDPFPSEDDLCLLAEQTGLSTSQVVNWTTNVRKRNRKAVLDNKKKPHHFIDFLFLVQERENKKAESRRMFAWQQRKPPEYHPSAGNWQQCGPSRSHQQHYHDHNPHQGQRYPQGSQLRVSLHRRSNSQMFSPIVPQYQGLAPSDLTAPDACISKRIFDEVEDTSASAKQYDDLMSVKIEEWAEVDAAPPAVDECQYRQSPLENHNHSPQQGCIMPTVATDSHDDSRHRISSLDFEMEHHGKEIDDFVAKTITTNEESL